MNHRSRILKALVEQGCLRQSFLSDAVGIKPTTINEHLHSMVLEGLLFKPKHGYYDLTLKGREAAEELLKRRDAL